MVPKTSAAAAKSGVSKKTPSCGMSQARASSSWPPMWAKAARMERLTGPNQRAGRWRARRQEEAGGEEVAKQQAAGQHAQGADPDRCAPAVANEDDEGDDVGQPRLDAGQWRGDCGVDQRQADGRRGQPGDAAVFGGDGEFNN